MDAIVFIVLGLALLWLFSRTPDADRPLAVTEPMGRSWGLPITLALLGMLAVLLFVGGVVLNVAIVVGAGG